MDADSGSIIMGLARARLLPVYHDAVTWGIHQTGANYTVVDRGMIGSALMSAMVHLVAAHFAVMTDDGLDPGDAYREHAENLLITMRMNLGLPQRQTEVSPALNKIEALGHLKMHLDYLTEELDQAVDCLSPVAAEQAVTARLLAHELVKHLVKKHGGRDSAASIEKWFRAVITAVVPREADLPADLKAQLDVPF